MAHFQTGDCICYRKGGPTHRVRSVLEDGRLLVSTRGGGTKFLTRPEDFVRIEACAQTCGCPFLTRLRDVFDGRLDDRRTNGKGAGGIPSRPDPTCHVLPGGVPIGAGD